MKVKVTKLKFRFEIVEFWAQIKHFNINYLLFIRDHKSQNWELKEAWLVAWKIILNKLVSGLFVQIWQQFSKCEKKKLKS